MVAEISEGQRLIVFFFLYDISKHQYKFHLSLIFFLEGRMYKWDNICQSLAVVVDCLGGFINSLQWEATRFRSDKSQLILSYPLAALG